MFDPDKIISTKWLVNCPNDKDDLHEVRNTIIDNSKNYELHILECEYCNYYAEKEVKK
tara:strand:+ start:161 stop:334 length:174 start_codon:yes stop_codon:yes gene_type:complete